MLAHSLTTLIICFPADLGDPCDRGVRGHDSQGKAAALVQADYGRIRRRTVRQLHNIVEGWEAV